MKVLTADLNVYDFGHTIDQPYMNTWCRTGFSHYRNSRLKMTKGLRQNKEGIFALRFDYPEQIIWPPIINRLQ